MRLGRERVNKLRVGDDPNPEGVGRKRCEEPVVDPSAPPEAMPMAVEGKARNNHSGECGGADRDMRSWDSHAPCIRLALLAVPLVVGNKGRLYLHRLQQGGAS